MPGTTRVRFATADAHARAIGVAETLKLFNGRKASLKLNIIVIGCGLGGLAAAHALAQAGHRVTIVESAPAIGEIGAGIQVTPNLSRILIRWGLAEQLKRIAVMPEAVALRRWNTGELVGWTKWGTTMERDYGAPYYHIHRADFHRLLLDLAAPLITLRLNSTVASLSSSTTQPSLTLTTGETLSADLIVGADGVKSLAREVVLGAPVKAVPTGDAAYRLVIPTEKMVGDPELRQLVEQAEMTGWMGPNRHIMAYCISAKREYNMVLVHPDDGSVECWTAEGSAEKMRADFAGWDPRIEKLLSMVPTTLKWKLMDRQPLRTWVHQDGRIVLLGDACHPMLPYRAQGAAMAVEDAVVLGSLLSRLTHIAELAPLLRGYETIRHARTAATQASSRLNQRIFHYPDGPEQEARDASMRQAMAVARKCEEQKLARERERRRHDDGHAEPGAGDVAEGECAGNANQWADRQKNFEQFGYDADAEAERWWREAGELICRHVVATAMSSGVSARM